MNPPAPGSPGRSAKVLPGRNRSTERLPRVNTGTVSATSAERSTLRVQGLQQRQAAGELVRVTRMPSACRRCSRLPRAFSRVSRVEDFLVADAQGLLGAGKAWQQGAGEQRQAQLTQGFKGHGYVSGIRVALQAWRRREG